MQQRHPLWLKQQPGKLLYLKPWYRAVWFQKKSSFSTEGCVFCVAAASECGILRRLITLTEAALFKSTFRYPLQLLCQPSCLCACKFNLFLFQPRELHCYNKMKGGIILLWDLRRKWVSQHRRLLFLSSPLFCALCAAPFSCIHLSFSQKISSELLKSSPSSVSQQQNCTPQPTSGQERARQPGLSWLNLRSATSCSPCFSTAELTVYCSRSHLHIFPFLLSDS